MEKKPARAVALLPIGVFLVLYLGLGCLFEYGLKIEMGFYNITIVVAFLAAILVACLQNRALSFDEKLEVMAKGVGDKNIMTMILIFLAAGVFVPLGLTLNPMFGAAAMSLSSFCVVSNALRLNLFKLRDNRHDHKRTNHLNNEIKEEQAMEKTLEIKGMMCPHCEAAVKKALEAIPEVVDAEVSHTAGTAVVTLQSPVDDAALKKAVEDKDYKVLGIE